jgi:hypothetical protein
MSKRLENSLTTALKGEREKLERMKAKNSERLQASLDRHNTLRLSFEAEEFAQAEICAHRERMLAEVARPMAAVGETLADPEDAAQ